jgi:membrane-associated phospholipid phosphatase
MVGIYFFQSFSSPFLDSFFQGITVLGEEYFFMAVVALVFWCINKPFGYRLGFTYLSNGVLNSALKNVFQVPRPIVRDPGIRILRPETATGFSFPSGHTQSTAAFFTSFMVRFKKAWLTVVGIVFIVLVGISRLYLGHHTIEDVAVAAVLGTGWVFLANALFDYAERTGRKAIFLLIIVPAIVGLFFFPDEDYFKVTGATISFFLGYIIESRYIRFETRARLWQQIIKFVAGLGVLLAIQTLLKPVLPDALASDLIRYFLMGLWVTVGAPWVFKRVFPLRKDEKAPQAGN